MTTVRLRGGSSPELCQRLRMLAPGPIPSPGVRLELLDYQAIALFVLAQQFNRRGAQILEIGTGRGGSAQILSRAAPLARILSLTPSAAEMAHAAAFWKAQGCGNVSGVISASWDFLARDTGVYDLVFIDGDHNRIARDLPWFDRLAEGGLLLCHDYSPSGSRSPSAIVYAELNRLSAGLGRPFDVEIVDDGKVGMAGFYRRSGEVLPPAGKLGEPPPCSPVQSPNSIPARWLPTSTGIVLRHDDAKANALAAAQGAGCTISDGWSLPWPRTLFAGPLAPIPWDLLRTGFELLRSWDVAAPFAPGDQLAQDIGTAEEQARTEALMLDLRVPIYSPDLVFVRDSAEGRAWLAAWREECADGTDERLAFLRALARVKPLFCALPRVWLADPRERAALHPVAATPAVPPKPKRSRKGRA